MGHVQSSASSRVRSWRGTLFRVRDPPKTKGDLAFVQHMLATANKTGMVGVVMSHR
jgi:type I restriction-modification system DNA methylase subunit